MQIEDGKGKGYKVKIDDKNKLYTFSHTITDDQVASIQGRYYTTSSGMLPVTATGGRMQWIKLTETSKVLLLSHISVSWNGGSTNYNRPVKLGIYALDSEPSANKTASLAYNQNSLSSNTASMTIWNWDSVGDGLTIGTPGINTVNYMCQQGYTNINFRNAWILGPNSIWSFGLYPTEAGYGQVVMAFQLMERTEFDSITG